MDAIQLLSGNPSLRIGTRPGDWKINTEPYSPHLLVKISNTFCAKVWHFITLPFTWVSRIFSPRRVNWPLDLKTRDLFQSIQTNFKNVVAPEKIHVWNAVRLNLDKFDKLNISPGTKLLLNNLKTALVAAIADLEIAEKNEAATMIQALVRGFVKKKQFPKLKTELLAAKVKLKQQNVAAIMIQKRTRTFLAQKVFGTLKLAKVKNQAATTLQALVRGYQVRKHLPVIKFQHSVNTFFELVIATAKTKQPLAPESLKKAEMLLGLAIKYKEHETAAWLVTILGKQAKGQLILAPKDKFHNWLRKLADNMPKDGAISKQDLDFHALELGCGYKTANLMVMKGEVQAIAPKLTHCGLDVPPLTPIYDAQTWQFLSKHIPNLKELFAQFLNSFDPAAKAQFMQAATSEEARKVTLHPTAEGKLILEQIRKKITDVYVKSPYQSLIIDQWLKLNPSDFVIVRSTGKEDSETNSNAGGNASVQNVRPNAAAISAAMGQVIASYFGETSIIQRLQAGDQSMFKEEPLLPVLVQRMICEKNIGGVGSKLADIPRSGVLFTREHGKADDVTVVNAAYGSNEGVVASMVAVNTYEIHYSGIYPTLRTQPTRYVHLVDKDDHSKFIVGPIDNTPTIANRPVLNFAEIHDLKLVADTYASLYGDGKAKPMDMEFSLLKDAEGNINIYLFQIRPLMKPAPAAAVPSFIDLTAVKEVPQTLREIASVFMAGSPNVREISASASQVIFADDLPEALKAYENHPSVKDLQLIAIKKPAAVTSHPAVMLRPTGIPIFVVSDAVQWHKVQSLLQNAKPETPVLVCPQRGMVVRKTKDALTKPGLVSYPCPLEISLPSQTFPPELNEKARNELKAQLLEQVDEAAKVWQGGSAPLPLSLEELFDAMALKEAPIARQALAQLFSHLSKTAKQMWGKAVKDKSNQNKQKLSEELFEVLSYAFSIAKNNVSPALDLHAPQSMNRLIHLKKLSSLIFQEGSVEVLNCISYKTVLQGWRAVSSSLAQDFKELRIPTTPENTFLLSLKQFALGDVAKQKWLALIKSLPQKQKGTFIPMLKTLVEVGVFTPWINTIFVQAKSNEELFSEFQSCQAVLQMVAKRQQLIQQYSKQEALWDNPAFVEKSTNGLVQTFQKELGFDGVELEKHYKSANALGKLAILNLLQQGITVYDTIIKSVTGSSNYKADRRQQARHFHALLKGYMALFKTAIAMARPEEHVLMKNECCTGTFDNYVSYLEKGRKDYKLGFHNPVICTSKGLEQIGAEIPKMSDADLEALFKARDAFNVSATAVGSHACLNVSVHWPTTLEEHFTTIHQSAETIVHHLQTKFGLKDTVLPQHIRAFVDQITPKFGNISDIVVNEKTVEVRYQFSLRQHGATLVLTAGKEPSTPMQLALIAYGNEEHDRWKQTAVFGAILVSRFDLRFVNNARPKIDYLAPKGVEFSIEIPAGHPQLYPQLANALHDLLFVTSMSHVNRDKGGIMQLASELTLRPGYKPLLLKDHSDWTDFWVDLPESTHEQSFFMGIYAMNAAWGSNNYGRLVKIAEKTLLGLINCNLKDFPAQFPSAWIPECSKDDTLAFFKNDTPPRSLKKEIFSALIMASRKDPSVCPHVKALLANPTIAQHFHEEVKNSTPHIAKPEEIYKQLLAQAPAHELLAFAYASGNPQWIETAQAKMSQCGSLADEIFKFLFASTAESFVKALPSLPQMAHQKGQLPEVATQLCSWYEKYSQDSILMYKRRVQKLLAAIASTNLVPGLKEKIAGMASKEKRTAYLTNLTQNLSKLVTTANLPPSLENEQTLATCAKDIFIGLVQMANPLFVGANLSMAYSQPFIGKYLANPQYAYFPGNNAKSTAKVHKMAAFTLLRILENKEHAALGLAALQSIIWDFYSSGHKDPGAAFMKPILFALTYSYLRIIHKSEILPIMAHLWGRDRNLLSEFSAFVKPLDTDLAVLPHLTLKMSKFPLDFPSGFAVHFGPVPAFDDNKPEFESNKIKTVVSLLEPKKMAEYALPAFYEKQSITLIACPIDDFAAPPSLPSIIKLTEEIFTHVKKGNIYVHCHSGQGRTGTILACLTARMHPDWSFEQVMQFTRTTSPGAVETKEQKEFVKAFVAAIKPL